MSDNVIIPRDKNYIDKKTIFYYLLLFATLGALFATQPFLRYPYDMWEHLIAIDEFRLANIPLERSIWHSFWRKAFVFFSIDPSQIFLRAKIIHTTQILFSFFAIYLFSKVIIRHIFTHIDLFSLRYMAYWSTLIWFTIFATFSMHYHLVWTLWYSIGYQITLPLFWYILALTIILLFEPISWKLKAFYLIQVLLISLLILRMHSMEYLYYVMYLLVLSLLFWRKIITFVREYYAIVIPATVLLLYFTKQYQPEQSQLFDHLRHFHFSELYATIVIQGQELISGANRSGAVINELMKVTLLLGLAMLLFLRLKRGQDNHPKVDRKMFLFLFVTSLFVLIPLTTLTGGLAAVATRMNVVHRLYFSASLFVLLPVTLYYFIHLTLKKHHLLSLNLAIVTVLLSTLLYSKYFSATHNYAKNIHSVMQSFDQKTLGFNLNDKEIEILGKELKQYKKRFDDGKLIVYYARPDIAIVLLLAYREKVFWWGRREYVSLEDFQEELRRKGQADFHTIIFETPKGFPEYIPFK